MGNDKCKNCEHHLGNGWCKYPICLKEPMDEKEEEDYKKWLAEKYPKGN